MNPIEEVYVIGLKQLVLQQHARRLVQLRSWLKNKEKKKKNQFSRKGEQMTVSLPRPLSTPRELGKNSLLPDKLLKRALLRDPSFIHHEDTITQPHHR